MNRYLAFDLGASSGRAFVGLLENEILKLDEIYRFSNEAVQINGSNYWDLLRIYQELKKGMLVYKRKYGSKLASIGIDSWGVDFVLLDEKDEPVGLVHTYRDNRTRGMLERMLQKVTKEQLYNKTGIQFMPINSSTQLFSMIESKNPEIEIVKYLLMVPDYLNFLLSGKKYSEFSIVTTTQLFNPILDNWAYDIIDNLGFKRSWFVEVKESGTIIGNLKSTIADEVGLSSGIKVIAPLCHDTASAIAAIPVDNEEISNLEWAYISSGTWSLLGAELERPLINEKAMNYNFTNEGGINKTARFLKNLTGLWVIQECKRIWNKKLVDLQWNHIDQEAQSAPTFRYFIDPDDPCFLNPPNMVEEIKNYCKIHNQEIPSSIGEIARTIYESMAFNYKRRLIELEDIINKKVRLVHIVGGGSLSTLLNQFTSNALNMPVIAGPSEATAIGNILVQALTLGDIPSLEDLRKIVRKSFPISKYFPKDIDQWDQGYKTFMKKIQ
jgi:rhamnulokinase